MAKRKFDSKRAYRLSSRVVIAFGLLLGLFGVLQLNSVFRGEYSLDKIEQRCHGLEAKSACILYSFTYGGSSPSDEACSGAEAETTCRVYYYSERRKFEESGWRNLGMATALLITFFGGTKLYRYLFPVQKKEDQPGGS